RVGDAPRTVCGDARSTECPALEIFQVMVSKIGPREGAVGRAQVRSGAVKDGLRGGAARPAEKDGCEDERLRYDSSHHVPPDCNRLPSSLGHESTWPDFGLGSTVALLVSPVPHYPFAPRRSQGKCVHSNIRPAGSSS